jgi:hypothetical protein
MNTNKILIPTLFCSSLLAAQAQTTIITDWNFDGQTVAAPDNSPAPSTGAGTASVLGMNNTYTFESGPASSSAWADVTPTAGASTGSGSSAWRIRGGTTGAGTGNSGWNTAASIGTQGAQFMVSTVGYSDINVSFDLYFTTAAPAKIELEYTTDGSTWNNAVIAYSANPSLIANNSASANTVDGTYFYNNTGVSFTGGWFNDITANLSGVPTSVANDPNFGIRIVNAATGADDVNAADVQYNNNSGNVRLDNVVVSDVTPVPEPSTLAFGALGLAAIGFCRRIRKG